jgi:YVTN family beta-propeller protein
MVLPDGSKLFVDNSAHERMGSHYIAVVDPCTRSIVKKIPVPGPPLSTLTRDGSTLCTALVFGTQVLRVDTKTDTIVRTYSIPPSYDALVAAAPSPDGQTLWIATADFRLYSIDTNTGQQTGGPIIVGITPAWLVFTPDGKQLITTNVASDSVSIVDVATRSVAATIPTGRGSIPEYGDVTPTARFSPTGAR